MTEMQLLFESLGLLAVGMGIVFAFLLLLVGVLRVMSWVALRLAPVEPQPVAAALKPGPPDDDDLIAVIAAAIARYRSRRH
jgi:oxaloacetate decarboxylase gamma subunit